jgi:predicted transcriptional regulator
MATTSDTFSVRLPEELRKQVDDYAKLTKRSRAFVVKEAVDAFMRQHAGYLRELDEALESAKSGVGHSSEQIFSWMRTWGTPHEYPLPRPDVGVKSK